MQLQNFYAQDVNGNIVPGAVCTLYIAGTTTLATGLQDANGAPLTNPFNANSIGLASVAAPQGVYDLQIVSGLINSKIRIQFIDVAQVSADATSASASAAAASSSAAASAAAAAQTITLTAQFIAPSATNPTTRDNGQPLQIGDRYFNTSTQLENIYRSSGWSANTGALSLSQSSGATQVGAIMPDGSTGNMQSLADLKANLLDLSDTASPTKNSGMIGFNPLLAYSAGTVGEALKSSLRKTVKSFGAVGDGSTDDTVAVMAAIAAAGPNGLVVFDANSEFLVSGGTLVQPTGQQWVGEGGQRSARIKKGSNGDLVQMGSLGSILDLTLNNNGTNFTGRGIYVPSGFSQSIFRVRSVQSKGPSLEFAIDAGGGCNVVAFEGDTIDQSTVGAIKFAGDTGPHPRLLNGIWLSGGFLDIASPGAGNGCSMSSFYIRNIKTVGPVATGTALMHFSNGRFATMADTTTLSGSDLTMVGVAFSGPVLLQDMQGLRATACTFGAGITEDFATCRFNSYSDQVKTFSPTWSQNSGPQPAIGNGSLTGKYTREGFLVKFEMTLTVGSTTTFGNSAGPYLFSLPIGGTQNSTQNFLAGWAFDASASNDYQVKGQIAAGANALTLSRNGSGVRDGFPFSWASGDTINVSITYMAI